MDLFGAETYSNERRAESLVLFHDRAVNDFLRLRGALLPDDERRLVERWARTAGSVHDVRSLDGDVGLTLRDLRSGDVISVPEASGGEDLTTGQLVYAHVLPGAVGPEVVDEIVPVPIDLREPLLKVLDAGAAIDVALVLAELPGTGAVQRSR